ncbi:hypothetical protein [Liquorilactobacillus sucicola]|nr:hypothetical protein [Liquorilactobacillus sucicola]
MKTENNLFENLFPKAVPYVKWHWLEFEFSKMFRINDHSVVNQL